MNDDERLARRAKRLANLSHGEIRRQRAFWLEEDRRREAAQRGSFRRKSDDEPIVPDVIKRYSK